VLSGTGYRKEGDREKLAVFREAKAVWGYFYRLDTAEVMITDGAIEQWEFRTEKQAEDALKSLREVDHRPFFNTDPFYRRKGPFLFIFHDRSMGFSYEQKPLFERFERMMKGSVTRSSS
jgi:hypothetical protein